MEEKKKINKNTQSQKVAKKTTKTNTPKSNKTSSKKITTTTKSKTVKAKTKTTNSKNKTIAKKATQNSTLQKQATKKEIPKKEEIKQEQLKEKEQNLEKTIIFDGTESKNILEVVDKLEEENVIVDDKVVKRSKLKKVIIIILSILILFTICATIYYVVDEKNKEEKNSLTVNSNIFEKANDNYKTLSDIKDNNTSNSNDDNNEYKNIENITLADFERKAYNKEDMTVFVSSTTCYHSITFESIIDEVYNKLDKKIYRINISNLTDKEVDRFRTYFAFTATPTLFVVKDGIVTSAKTGTMTSEQLEEWVKENE